MKTSVPFTLVSLVKIRTLNHMRGHGYHWITDGPSRVYCGMNHLVRTSTTIILKLVTSQDTIVLMTLN